MLIPAMLLLTVFIALYMHPLKDEVSTDCRIIKSMTDIQTCIGKNITAIGTLECNVPKGMRKGGVHFLVFKDGTQLKFLEEYPTCKDHDGNKVEVTGMLYQCGREAQCSGIGLSGLDSIKTQD